MGFVSGPRDVPAILRRCVVSVYYKTSGGGQDGVVRAFKICRDQLAKQGYMFHRGKAQILEDIGLTGKGYIRNLQHETQGITANEKDLKFDALFAMIAPRLWEYDGPGGKQPPQGRPSADGTASAEEVDRVMDGNDRINNIVGGDFSYLYPRNIPPKK